jgi:hypothetical protein
VIPAADAIPSGTQNPPDTVCTASTSSPAASSSACAVACMSSGRTNTSTYAPAASSAAGLRPVVSTDGPCSLASLITHPCLSSLTPA